MKIEHSELNTIFKYCYNEVDYDAFSKVLELSYGNVDAGYIEENWGYFQTNMFAYISQRKEVFDTMCHFIKETNYKG